MNKFSQVTSAILLFAGMAAAPAAAETFYACAHKENGKLRMVSAPGNCHATENEVVWSSGEDSSKQINELQARVDALEYALGVMNLPPSVNAGADQTVLLSDGAVLSGTASDDGLALPLTFQWARQSGPDGGNAYFTVPDALASSATFDIPGTYVLSLSVSDGIVTVSDEVAVIVYPDNTPPAVDAGPDAVGTVTTHITSSRYVCNSLMDCGYTLYSGYVECVGVLNGSVTDDGLPQPLSFEWASAQTRVDSPQQLTTSVQISYSFSNSRDTSHGLTGQFPVTLSANDGYYTVTDTAYLQCN